MRCVQTLQAEVLPPSNSLSVCGRDSCLYKPLKVQVIVSEHNEHMPAPTLRPCRMRPTHHLKARPAQRDTLHYPCFWEDFQLQATFDNCRFYFA